MPQHWLYPGPRAGLLVREAREWRIEVRDGALVEHLPGGIEKVLANPGEVNRVAVVSGDLVPRSMLRSRRFGPTDHDQVLVVRTGASAVLGLKVPLLCGDFTTGGVSARAAAALGTFAQGLGLPVERGEAEDVAALRGVSRVEGPLSRSLRRTARLHLFGVLVFAALFLVDIVLSAREGAAAANHLLVLGPVALILLVLTVDLARRRLAFRASTIPPPSHDRRVVGGRGAWTLHVGPDDVVLHGGIQEHWVPGPRRAGVDECHLHDDAAVFAQGEVPRLIVPLEMIDPDDLRPACHAAGIDVSRRRGPGRDSGTEARVAEQRAGRILALYPDGPVLGNGVLFGPLVVTVAALLLLALACGPDSNGNAGDLMIASAAGAVLVVQAALWWARRRWVATTRERALHDAR